jgi:hypothetical protein
MPLIKNPGRYTATVKTAELGQSAEKGTPYLSLLCKTAEGDELTAYLYLSDAAFERTTKTLREVFGFDNNFETIVEQVTGKECSIVVEAEEYEGKTRMRVKWVNTVSGSSGKPLENAGSLLAQLSAKAKRIPAATPTSSRTAAPASRPAPAARPPTPKPAAVDEDVPF